MPKIGRRNFNTRHSPGRGIVAQCVRMDGLGDAGAPRCLTAGVPDGLVGDRLVGASCLPARKHPPIPLLDGAVIGPQLLEQLRAERDFPVLASFALADADYHAFFVDVLGPEVA